MAVFKQTAVAGTVFDGTPARGFVDLASGVGVDAVNTERRFVLATLSVNRAGAGMITAVRVVLALSKADADGIDHFSHLPTNTNGNNEWTLRGPIVVPNGYSLFVYQTVAGADTESRLLLFGGVLSRDEGFDF